LKKIVFC